MQRLFVECSTRGCHTHSPHDVLVSDSLSIPEKHGCCSHHVPHVSKCQSPLAPPVPLTAIPVPAAVELRSPVTLPSVASPFSCSPKRRDAPANHVHRRADWRESIADD